MHYESREEMLAAFGPYAALFEPLQDVVLPYLTLLHMGDGARKVVQCIKDVVGSNEDLEAATSVLLRDENWRPHLVGAVAVYLGVQTAETLEQVWRTLDAGSWVVPQLAAVLSLVDRHFLTASLERLTKRCPIIKYPDYETSDPIEGHVARGPANTSERSCKAVSSLLFLLSKDYPEDRDVVVLMNDPGIAEMIADDVDDGARIALEWRHQLIAQAARAT